jgi:hypothetical protein
MHSRPIAAAANVHFVEFRTRRRNLGWEFIVFITVMQL